MKAILFDLDGTLLASDLDDQLREYLARVARYVGKTMPELAPTLPRDFMETTFELMRDGSGSATVREQFFSRYCKRSGARLDDILPVLDTFYRTEYGEIGTLYTPVPQIQQAIALCKQKGYKRVVATNCFYPLSAISWRIRWAGLDPSDFDAITHYENMHYTKPHLGYFREAAALIGEAPEHCAMIGNNGVEDMAAAKLGMRTFLLTNFAMDAAAYQGERGDYDELLAWLGR